MPALRRSPWLCSWFLPVICTLLLPVVPASARPGIPPWPRLTPDASSRLRAAAVAPTTAPWQREFMHRLARGERPAPAAPGIETRPPASPAGAADAENGCWLSLPSPSGRAGHVAVYDPVRNRIVLFGGSSSDAYGDHFLDDVWALSLSGSPTWSQILTAGTPPKATYAPAAIYDPAGDRMVVCGGYYYDGTEHFVDEVWALTFSGTPTWTQLAPAGTSPLGRAAHTAVYDPANERMIVCGGFSFDGTEHYLNDVWALTLSGTPTWSELAPAGTLPGGRYGHAAAYDPGRSRMVLFGGYVFDGMDRCLSDTWELTLSGTPTWSELTPVDTIPGRFWHTAIFDPGHDRMIVFGGGSFDTTGSHLLNDVWALSLSGTPTWSALASEGIPPAARDGHVAVYDPGHDQMVVFGGASSVYGGAYASDTWTLTLAEPPTWSRLTPSARAWHSALYDPVRDRVVVFGGENFDGTNYELLDDVWALTLSGTPAWSRLTPAGTPPAARAGHSAIYDPVRDRMLVFGGYGYDTTSQVGDVWALTFSGTPTWSQITPTGTPPAARAGHTAIYDPGHDRMVVFGGGAYGELFRYYNDVWALTLSGTPAWNELTTAGTPPAQRVGHTAIHDVVRNRMVIYGGFEYVGVDLYWDDVWTLTLSGTPTWRRLWPGGTPPGARYGHTAVYDPARDRMLAFGGGGFSSSSYTQGYLNDVWALDLEGMTAWSRSWPAGEPPSARLGAVAVYDPVRDRMLMFGGDSFSSSSYGDYEQYVGDTWALWLEDIVAAPGPQPIERLSLGPSRPNPARSDVAIAFALPHPAAVTLRIYDAAGRAVRTLVEGAFPAGNHKAQWDGRTAQGECATPGIYFYELRAGGERLTKRLVLLR